MARWLGFRIPIVGIRFNLNCHPSTFGMVCNSKVCNYASKARCCSAFITADTWITCLFQVWYKRNQSLFRPYQYYHLLLYHNDLQPKMEPPSQETPVICHDVYFSPDYGCIGSMHSGLHCFQIKWHDEKNHTVESNDTDSNPHDVYTFI